MLCVLGRVKAQLLCDTAWLGAFSGALQQVQAPCPQYAVKAQSVLLRGLNSNVLSNKGGTTEV